MRLARKVYKMGIPTPPRAGRLCGDRRHNRYGIRFHRILGKTSYSRATADHPEKVQQYAEEFAEMCLQLHSTHVDTTQFENVKDRYYRLLAQNRFFTTAEKDKISGNSSPTFPTPIRPFTATCSFPTPSSQPTNAISSTSATSAMAIRSSTWAWCICAVVSATKLSSKKFSTWTRPPQSSFGNASLLPISAATAQSRTSKKKSGPSLGLRHS